jgi:tripartite-type tricarboxylate transporter receptor subunit TctC
MAAMIPDFLSMTRRRALLASALMPAVATAWGQTYPARPIRIVVPFPAGGFADVYARIIANKMADTFGQPVIVDNKPGAGGNIGTEMVARSPADGYTLVTGTIGTHAINATLFANLPYDPVKDFAPVAFVVDADGLLVVNPALPVQNVADLVKLAKERPGQLNYASAGMGTTSHLAGEMFKSMTQTELTHVAYKGNVPAIQDVLSGQVQLMFASLPTVLPQVKAGKLRAVAVLGAHRSQTLPDVPTVAESGVPGFQADNWTALFAPAGTPPAVVAKLNAEVQRIMGLPEVQQRMAQEGLRYLSMTAPQLGSFVQAEVKQWGAVVRRLDLKVE